MTDKRQTYTSYFRRGIYDPYFVLNQIKEGYPLMTPEERVMALEEACHEILRLSGELEVVKMHVKKLAEVFGYEVG